MSQVKRKVKLNKMDIVKSSVSSVLDNVEQPEPETETKENIQVHENEEQKPKPRMIRGLSLQQYNSEYMYRYKLVKQKTTEDLLKTKQSFLKKINYIDEELKQRNEQINNLKEEKKLKAIEGDMENMKKMYEKMKMVFEKE